MREQFERWIAKEQWCTLLRQYCALDSLSWVLIFEHLRRVSRLAE